MLPKEILKKIRRIEITTSHLVNDVFAGQYHSVFKGRGMEFSEVREYQPGDDIRSIDWNVTARMGHPYIKKFVEEREMTVMLMVDASSSGEFGTTDQMKGAVGTEICALLAFSAIKNNDKVGLIIFTDKVEKYIPPKKGKAHVLRVIRELLYFKPQDKGTDINAALDFLNQVIRRRSVTFLISDFISPDFSHALAIANKKHDLIAITISDPREMSMVGVGLIELEDAETGERILVDSSDPHFLSSFLELTQDELRTREKIFRTNKIDVINIVTDQPYVKPLVTFFRMRAKRLKT